MANVLIIDDDQMWCKALGHVTRQAGHHPSFAFSGKEGLACARNEDTDIILLDVGLPDGSGLDLIPYLRSVPSEPEVIIITAAGDPDGAELAIKNGAWDYFQKSTSLKEILLPLERAVQYRQEKQTRPAPVSLKRDNIVGNSPKLRACLDRLAQASVNNANVLITGETGTGKELFARAVHENSSRASRHFVVVDCASLPETLVESVLFGHVKGAFTGADHAREGLIAQANQGTLFLDEVGELPLRVQRTLLRVLQDHRYRPVGSKREVKSNFRLVAATHRDLEAMVTNGEFRQDLLFRLRMLAIELPPLRTRREDIKMLTLHYLDKLGTYNGKETKGLTPEFLDVLTAYDWPGNVRELMNTLISALTQAEHDATLYSKHLPDHMRICLARNNMDTLNQGRGATIKEPASPLSIPTYKTFKKQMELQYIHHLLNQTQGDLKAAIKISALSRSRFYALLKKKQPLHISSNKKLSAACLVL